MGLMVSRKAITRTVAIALAVVIVVAAIGGTYLYLEMSKTKKVEITFMYSTAMQPYLEVALDDFDDEYGDTIKVDRRHVPYGEYLEKLSVALSAGSDEYDLVCVSETMGPSVFAAGWLEPLMPLYNNPDLRDPDFNIDDFIGKTIDLLCKDLNGTLVAFPSYYQATMLVWRKDLFEEYGIVDENGDPIPPDTFDKLYEFGKTLTVDTDGDGEIDQYGLAMEGIWWCWDYIVWCAAWGTDFFWDEDTHRPIYDQPEAVEALEFAKKVWSEICPPGAISERYPHTTYYIPGKAAMATSWSTNAMEQPDSAGRGVTGYLSFPAKVRASSYVSGWATGISKYSKHKEEAFKLLQYLLKPETQVRHIDKMCPTVEQALTPDLIEKYPYLQAFVETAKYGEVPPRIVELRESFEVIKNWVTKYLIGEIAEAEVACANIQSELETLWADYIQ